MAGVSLDFAFGSDVEGSSVSIGAKVSPSRHMPSNRPPADESTDRVSVSAKVYGEKKGWGWKKGISRTQ